MTDENGTGESAAELDSIREPAEVDLVDLRAAMSQEPLVAARPENEKGLFMEMVRLVTEGQRRMNLTAIREPKGMVRYLIADSLALGMAVEQFPVRDGQIPQAADIGTGAGFPLLPMAVMWPEIRWTGVESVKKKASFVEATAHALGLANVSVLAERAEDVGRGSGREEYDLVTSRAVGSVSSLLEVCLPLLNKGGRLYLFKTEQTRAEWRSCDAALEMLGGEASGEYKYRLPQDEQERVIFVVEKVAPTPRRYPRPAGDPFRKPLVTKPEPGGMG